MGFGFKESGRCVGRELSGSQNNRGIDREGDLLLSPSGWPSDVSIAHSVTCDDVSDKREGLGGGCI